MLRTVSTWVPRTQKLGLPFPLNPAVQKTAKRRSLFKAWIEYVRPNYSFSKLCLLITNYSSIVYILIISYFSYILYLHSPSPSFRSSADTCLLQLLLYKYNTKSDRAYFHFGPSVWNSLPSHIRNAATISTFMSFLKTHPFNLNGFD